MAGSARGREISPIWIPPTTKYSHREDKRGREARINPHKTHVPQSVKICNEFLFISAY